MPNIVTDNGAGMTIKPNVGPDNIAPGDTYVIRVKKGSETKVFTEILPYYFVTSVALKSYDDGNGVQTISYPVSSTGAGTRENPILIGSTSLTLTFWPPQRQAIPGAESGDYMDMGGLRYGAVLSGPNSSSDVVSCASSDFSNPSSTLTPVTMSTISSAVVYRDTAGDSAPNASRTMSFKLDVGACLARAGYSTSGTTFTLDLNASDRANDNVIQQIRFRLP